jgi:16S rRNA C967 or C1407 C5-methylase (RsmB/RsmF family)
MLPVVVEGTAFRDSSIVDHWHEKNIDRIAKLQKQLMETAEAVTAPGGTLSYSTCTLNKEENERVIESAIYNLQSTMVEDKKNSQIDNWRLIIEDWSLQKNMVMLFVSASGLI